MEGKIRLGVSACLLGEKVRYDGGHQWDRYLTGTLGQYFEFVPVCPEVEIGLPVPRGALRLVGEAERPRLVTSRSGQDLTERMETWAAQRVVELEREGLCGFIFKGRSPSSGMARVKLYEPSGIPSQKGVGLFARIFMQHFPLLPVEEDGRLHDPKLRENFIECVFTFKRWRDLLAGELSLGRLVEFHSRHKLLLLAHSTEIYRQMGKLVADGKALPAEELFQSYEALLMKGMRLLPTVKKHLNVLQHLLGYFKNQLSSDEKQELLEIFEQYRRGDVPLVVPVTMINHLVRKYQQPYLAQQFYLHPHPGELRLRNS